MDITSELNETQRQNKTSWDAMADSWFGTTALPTLGCFVPDENELQLFPDLSGKRVLDIGCGSGHSLRWCGNAGASELWGLDLSGRQIENARRFLDKEGYEAKLFNLPMEVDASGKIPADYFDVVYSIYAIGWTTDLFATLKNAASYLKKDGVFIFSWDHPLMHCMETQNEKLVFSGSYLNDESFSYIQRGQPVTVQNRRISTYINSLSDAGFAVERLIEESRPGIAAEEFSSSYYSAWKAARIPLSFIIKARKL